MQNFISDTIKLEDLYLDEKNPRFIIPPNPTQQSIIDYLIEYEEAEQLVLDINKSGGLSAGERVIVIKENERYIVLEGNRRVCACKILMNTSLLANKRPASVDKIFISEKTKTNIEWVSVDIMNNRVEAQSSLAVKHIDGVKKWSTFSKYKFFALEFDNNKSINEIENVTGVSQNKIKTGLKEYRIIEYVLGLSKWTNKEKEQYLNLQEMKISRLTRLFGALKKDSQLPKLRDLMGLDFDNKFHLITNLPKVHFDEILYIIAKAAFVPDYCPVFEGTRSTYDDIPQLMCYLEENKLLDDNSTNEKLVLRIESNIEDLNKNKETQSEEKKSEKSEEKRSEKSEEKKSKGRQSNGTLNLKNIVNKFSSSRDYLIPEDFIVECTNIKINNIIMELKRINLNYYINSAAVLLRVMIEISIKYYLEKSGNKNRIIEKDLPGTVNAALEIMHKEKLISNAEHSNLTKMGKREKSFDIFNGYVHYDSVLPTKDVVINFFDNYKKMIEICLNCK